MSGPAWSAADSSRAASARHVFPFVRSVARSLAVSARLKKHEDGLAQRVVTLHNTTLRYLEEHEDGLAQRVVDARRRRARDAPRLARARNTADEGRGGGGEREAAVMRSSGLNLIGIVTAVMNDVCHSGDDRDGARRGRARRRGRRQCHRREASPRSRSGCPCRARRSPAIVRRASSERCAHRRIERAREAEAHDDDEKGP